MSDLKQPYTVLVVDDTEANRYALCRTLKNEGYTTLEAASGREALAMIHKSSPDLVILDVHLPDLLGFEVCKQIKSEPATAHLPVLQVSASYVTTKDKIFGLEGGADTYLTHPIEPGVLIATVRSLQRNRALDQKLRVNEERLRLALRGAELGTWDIDLKAGTRELSERARVILDFDGRERVSWKTMLGKMRRVDRVAFISEIKKLRALESGGDFSLEVSLRARDRSLRWVSIEGAAYVEGEAKRPHRFVGTLRDVTEAHRVRQVIEDAKTAAENANSAKSRFLANISHEIRTPLGVILGFSDLAQDPDQSREDQVHSLAAIRRNAEQLSRLIDDLLDLSKIEADRMVTETIRFSLYDLIEEVISSISVVARERGLQLRVDFSGALPSTICSDPLRVRQILVNLIGNAVKFTEAGYVGLTISARQELVQGRASVLRFAIEDSGIGIAREKVEKLFEPFVQADSSTTRRYGGTGLGLMLSRRLARALGGDLVLERSAPAAGSLFVFSLPVGDFDGILMKARSSNVAKSESEAVRATPSFEKNDLDGMKILLVEDSVDNQVLIRRFLANSGARVSVASDGAEGVRMALEGTYDVVLMDIQMPVRDGYQAMRELRERGYERPIVALTAHALKGERESCLEAGFSDYLTKPISRSLLVDRLSGY